MHATTSPSYAWPSELTAPPSGWTLTEMVESAVVVDGIRLRRSGIAARSTAGIDITGAAAAMGRNPRARAGFELCERASLVEAIVAAPQSFVRRNQRGEAIGAVDFASVFPTSDAPDRWAFARSNGVALGRDLRDACRRARQELCERDRLLRSWYGEIAPERVALPDDLVPPTRSYDWEAYVFPAQNGWSAGLEVAAVVGFPRARTAPLIRGSAARSTRRAALQASVRECLQALAFLWEETIPEVEPPPAPTPLYHLDRFLWPEAHAALRNWLAGGHLCFVRDTVRASAADATVTFVELSPAHACGHRVVRALCDAARPLTFGSGPDWLSGHLPVELRPHPIA